MDESGRQERPNPTSPTFIVETVDAVYTGALVIAAQHEEVLGVFDLVTQQ